MKAYQITNGGYYSYSGYGTFKDSHVPVLVFQANALRRLYLNYHITRVDFLVLSAGYSIQVNSLGNHFTNPELKNTVAGVGHNILYKSLKRLLRLGIISLKEERRNHRRFLITERGYSCIAAFTQYFNTEVVQYNRTASPGFRMMKTPGQHFH